MLALARALLDEDSFSDVIGRIENGGCPVVLSGLEGIHKAHVAAAIRRITGRPVVVICSDEIECSRLKGDIEALTQEQAISLTARDFTFYNAESVSRQLEQKRILALWSMAEDRAPIVAATPDGIIQRTIPPETLKTNAMEIRLGHAYDMGDVAAFLTQSGYSRCDQVEGPGQFAVRGGIIDFFSPAYIEPVRCEFYGDEVDSLSLFNVNTQRRTEPLETACLLPAAETLISMFSTDGETGGTGLASALSRLVKRLENKKTTNHDLIKNITSDIERLKDGRIFPGADKYMELIYRMASGVDYLSPDSIILISDPSKVEERIKNYSWQLGEDITSLLQAGVLESGLVRFCLTRDDFFSRLEDYPVVMADSFTGGQYPLRPKAILNIMAKQLPSYGGSLETASEDISHYCRSGYRTLILCQDERRAEILHEFLSEKGTPSSLDFAFTSFPNNGTCMITLGGLSAGMEYPASKLAVITEGQVSEQHASRAKKKKNRTNREKLQSFTDLSPGDLVVHEHHGIGRYVGIFKLEVDGVEKDYVKIAYAGSDSLYVPATQLDLVSKYIGGGEDTPVKLSKMGGTEWAKTKSRAKAAAKEMAKDLIKLYAERRRLEGHAFAPDSVWQTEFEEHFGYQETDDQIRCTDEIKADMERPIPMDRLLCGDVGYGKTEVALRAAMKCILDGRQAALLVPTTVLAQQHYVTAMRRFAGYPVKIEVLSRLRSSSQLKTAAKEIESGSVDLVIGTHRLLQKDIKFSRLGLLIVDEEQRFGVSHKERLKEMARQIDVLTLSATPIPRTLNMALSGIRDMSTIEEPPRDRQPVQTYVLEHDWGIIMDAIRREISRGGQVYYVHNRVESIDRTASRISAQLKGVPVAVAHGKMDEETLSDVMERMSAGEIKVLVCTTIIETGIDIPNVNTLIIEDADRLGLSQLHQIRGRVGRSPRRAFAYLTFRKGKILTEIAEKRLSAIREFAEFNSGFKIAMRDLEIRGAGNLLGSEQSGHMMSVGYDMYLKLLEEAVLEEKGEKPKKIADCSADLSIEANIPEKYVPSGEQRMDLYRRIARIRNEDDADEMIAELIDRYGDPPSSVVSLVAIALLRGEAAEAGVAEISQKSGWLRLRLNDFDMKQVSSLYSMPDYKGRVRIEAGTVPVIALRLKTAKVVDEAAKFIRSYKNCRQNNA